MLSIFRLLYIGLQFFRYGLDGELNHPNSPTIVKLLSYLMPGRYLFSRQTRGQRIRKFLEKLGPVYIKFGQILSTRPDLVPEDIFSELSLLQDDVAPLDAKSVNRILQSYYQEPVETLFANFESTPIASASIAQVHGVTLHSGQAAVIKLVRPNIRKKIIRDLRYMNFFAGLLEKVHPDGQRLHPKEVVADYEYTILNEIDLEHEAANTSLLRENFKNSRDLYVPEIFWDYSNKNILCMERIQGIPVGNIAALEQANIDFKKLSERAVRIFFTQLLEHNFFHADMHPGNVFVDVSDPQDPSFIALDCAIMGSLEDKETITLAQLLNATFSRDYPLAAKIMIDSGWVDRTTSTPELASAIRTANEAVFAKPISEISFATQLMQLFFTGRRFNMQVQPSLVLLQKTLFNIEGLGKQLYPDLDLLQTAKPFIERWLKNRYSPLSVLRRHKKDLPLLIDKAPEIIEQLINPPVIVEPKKNNSNNFKKFLALLGASGLALLSAFKPALITNASPWLFLAGGIVLSWLWFSKN